MRLKAVKRATFALIAGAFAPISSVCAASSPLEGLSVENAITVLQRNGLRVFYSTDLVRPWMRVQVEPNALDPAAVLAEILLPFDLTTQPGPNGSVLVVRRTEEQQGAESRALAGTLDGNSPVLLPRPSALEEVVVAGTQYELRRAVTASQTLVTRRDLEYLPRIGDDSTRAVAWLPGMASNGVNALANVRGGDVAETLVRIDGLRLYDPFHLKDFQSVFSAIDPRIVDSMSVYTGGFPAVFGDRMSGVIDVQTMPAPRPLYHEISVSFFNSSLLSSGQYGDGRGQWLASVRRSNLDLLYRQFSELPDRPRYLDAFAKVDYELGGGQKIAGSILHSKDDISLSDDLDREEHAQADHSDLYAWVSVEHVARRRTSGKTLLAHIQLDSQRHGTSEETGVSIGRLSDLRSFGIDTLQSDWTTRLTDRLSLHFGGSLSRAEGRYDYDDEAEFALLFDIDGAATDTSRSRSISVRPKGEQYGAFATLRYAWTDRLKAELGVRFDKQTLDADHSDTLGPRLGLHYALSQRTDFRASWGRFYQSQAINELQVGDGVSEFSAPQRADHFVVGIDHAFARGLNLRAEAYEKTMHDLRPRYENFLNRLVLLPELKPDRIRIAPSRARATGVEISVDGALGSLQWWSSYTWSQVTDRLGTQDIPRSWDQTNAVSAGLVRDTERWNVSFGLLHRSGWPITRVALGDGGEPPLASIVGLNADRLDFYRSVDVRLTRKVKLARSRLAVAFEITNVFGHSNACCLEYEVGDEEEDGLLALERLNHFSTVPSLGVIWTF